MPAHELIRKRRNELHLSLEDLAVRLEKTWPADWPKLSKTFVWKCENKQRTITMDEAVHFARALECNLADLVDPLPGH